ncbi:hypothetical protein [Clostridium saccharobutylicum]|nr:hypothetical protein [Clostridium saccharobutylicum]NOV93210.1 hypothetical protein [Clostridium saccharobutylicum]
MNKKIESLISISMFNKNLTDLTGNLNKLLIFEEKSRSQSACQEKRLKK